MTLESAGFLVQPASSGQTALRWLREPSAKPDLVVLDIGLPDEDLDGLMLCKALKKDLSTRKIPVVLVTGYTDNEHKVAAMQAQADLVLSKPVSPPTLIDAVNKLLSRPRSERRGLLHRGNLEVDPEARTVFFNGKLIADLGPRLFDVFYFLAEQWPRVVTPRYVLSTLHLKERDDQVAVMISRLRARLESDFGCQLIATVPRQGYKLDLPEQQPSSTL